MPQEAKLDVKRLIMEVHKQPALWDQRHVLYHNRESTNRIWVEISTNLKISKSILKAKWKGLRDTFRAELKKELINRKSKNLKCKPTWVHYKHLLFLKEQMMSNPPPILDANGDECLDESDINSADDTSNHAVKESSKQTLNLSDVKVLINRDIVHHHDKEINMNSKKTINHDETNSDNTENSEEELKRPNRVKITSPRALMFKKCDCVHSHDVSLQIENSEEDDLDEEDIEVKQEPIIDNTVFQSVQHQVNLPQPLNENETHRTTPPEQVLSTDTNDKNVELSIDPLETHHVDDNYHFLISLLPHIKTLPAERQMLLRIQMQELVYKEVYRKNTD